MIEQSNLTKTQIGKTYNLIYSTEETNLSNLANSCEYLTSENLCLAASETEKSRASRQVRCKNDEKMTCCYLCMFVLDCANPCRFLGGYENEPQQVGSEKTKNYSSVISEEKNKVGKIENASVTFCSSCNVEMFQAKTKFKIDEWAESNQKSDNNDSTRFDAEVLPVIVYLCPKCGKIDFRADKKLIKK